MASSDVIDVKDTNTTITFLELITDIIDEFEPEVCLTHEIFWRQLPRVIEESYQLPEALEQEWETFKILLKRMEHYYQNHKEQCYKISLSDALSQLKKVMANGFKTSFSAKLQQTLTTWYENCKDILKDLEDLSALSRPTTHTSTSTTIAPTQEDHADASGEKKSRKRKIANLEDAFSDLADADELETSNYPIGNTSYYISQRRDGELSHRILMDK